MDLANARIYYYTDIAHVSGLLVSHPHHRGDPHRKQGASVIIRMKDNKQYMLGSFQNGMLQNAREIRANFEVFSELMHKYWQQTEE